MRDVLFVFCVSTPVFLVSSSPLRVGQTVTNTHSFIFIRTFPKFVVRFLKCKIGYRYPSIRPENPFPNSTSPDRISFRFKHRDVPFSGYLCFISSLWSTPVEVVIVSSLLMTSGSRLLLRWQARQTWLFHLNQSQPFSGFLNHCDTFRHDGDTIDGWCPSKILNLINFKIC